MILFGRTLSSIDVKDVNFLIIGSVSNRLGSYRLKIVKTKAKSQREHSNTLRPERGQVVSERVCVFPLHQPYSRGGAPIADTASKPPR